MLLLLFARLICPEQLDAVVDSIGYVETVEPEESALLDGSEGGPPGYGLARVGGPRWRDLEHLLDDANDPGDARASPDELHRVVLHLKFLELVLDVVEEGLHLGKDVLCNFVEGIPGEWLR